MPSSFSVSKVAIAAAALLLSGQAALPQAGAYLGLSEHLHKTKVGITLDYVEQGSPTGPVIVLIHGAGDSWHSYDRVFPLIPASFHVYAITLRGHGYSDHPATGFSSADFAGDIIDFLDQKNIHHATLVGHSLGSFVSQKIAEIDGEQSLGHLDRLVLIGSGPGLSKAAADAAPVLSAFSKLQDPIPYTFARDFQDSTIYAPVPAKNYEIWVREAQLVPAATWHGIGERQRDSSEELKKIKVPVLVTWGEKDGIFNRAAQDALIAALPNGKLSAYPETGHALHWERPERFTRELLSFIAGSRK